MKSLILFVIRWSYQYILKPVVFCFDAEKVHNSFIALGAWCGKSPWIQKFFCYIFQYQDKRLEIPFFGTTLISPIGLSAGFDYEGKLSSILPCLGFGFESVGTVTNRASSGNHPPRLGRLPRSESLLVNKGFKNSGIRNITKNLLFPDHFPIGLSIGATNSPQTADAESQIEDIVNSFQYIQDDIRFTYLELNISCPNVLGANSLADPKKLSILLKKIQELNIQKPLFIKFPIEIPWEEAKELISIMIEHHVSGIIIGNLAKNRQNSCFIKKEIEKAGKGNFSGKPTQQLSNTLIKNTYREFGDKLFIIGLGGIMSAEDAYKKIRLGASCVQLISGMIFKGPQIIYEIQKGLVELIERDGFCSLQEAIGTDNQ